jgi:hypothetical protein
MSIYMTKLMKSWRDTKWPACVGLTKNKGKRYEVWNDMGPIREVKWFYNFIPSRFIDWDNNGIKLKL